MPQINANGIGIYVEEHGDVTGTPLLMIRGLGSQIIHWPPAMIRELVDRGFRVITPDNRDAGLSEKFDSFGPVKREDFLARLARGDDVVPPYRVEDMAADHAAVLDHFEIDAAHVFGISMGGMIAQVMTAIMPERVLSLVSTMSSSGNPDLPMGTPEARDLLQQAPEDPDDLASVTSLILAGDRAWGSPDYPFDLAERRVLIAAAWERCWCPDGVTRQLAAVDFNGSRTEMQKTITRPTLVIHGLDDTLLPPEHGRDTARNIKRSILVEIPGMGHNLDGDLGPIIARLVSDHVRSLE